MTTKTTNANEYVVTTRDVSSKSGIFYAETLVHKGSYNPAGGYSERAVTLSFSEGSANDEHEKAIEWCNRQRD